VDTVEFGKTGLRVSRLAFGTGTHGWAGRSEQTDLGVDELAGLLRLAYDHGVNFWDAADAYGSHPHIAKALAGLPRDKVVIATKTSARSAEQVTRNVERFLRELGTDVIDVVLLHFMTQADWPQRDGGALAGQGARQSACRGRLMPRPGAVARGCGDGLGGGGAGAHQPGGRAYECVPL